jgi:N-acetyl-anhydromuramyl-L-alanine amidase AmpD
MLSQDKKGAEALFAALRDASIETLTRYNIPASPGFKTKKWRHGRPRGVILHYTAGVSGIGSARWLNNMSNTRSSCHFLVLDRKLVDVDDIYSKYADLDALPVTVLMLGGLDRATWHAGWVNDICVGIENRNAGTLKCIDETFCWWPNNWTKTFPGEELGKVPVEIDGGWWEPYTAGQVEANIILGRNLLTMYDGQLDRRWFLPHSAVKASKWDTGRAFPFHGVRNAVFDCDFEYWEEDWFKALGEDPSYMGDYDEEVDYEFLRQIGDRQGYRDEIWTFGDEEVCYGPPAPDLEALIDEGRWRDELDSVRRALNLLEYVVNGQGPELDADTAMAVYQFQRAVGLHADKIPGVKTQAALWERLRLFGLEKGK